MTHPISFPIGKRPGEFSRADEPVFSSLVSDPQANAGLLCLDPKTMELIRHALDRTRVRSQVYDRWGLSSVDPCPRTTLSFTGPSGTGKTLAAHYVARELGKRILEVSYADIVSKFFGQSAKNLVALYQFAAAADVVVFIDEAESFMSERITEVSEGSDHTINSLRSQFLTLLEKTRVVSIVASNLAGSFDPAFESRMLTIHFTLPTMELQERIWRAHLPKSLPLARHITPHCLAGKFSNLNGRQIARAVVEAAHRAAIQCQSRVRMQDFVWAVDKVMTTFDGQQDVYIANAPDFYDPKS